MRSLNRVLLVIAALLGGGTVSVSSAATRYYSNAEGLPFSEAVQVGDMLYLSGQIGVVPGTGKLVAGGIDAEARQTMENIGSILQRRGLTFDAVVKCTVMLGDIKDWPAFNAVYVGYFKPDRMPARSAFAASGLAYNGKVEVECWAYNPIKKAARH
ncbi:MAG: enamine deaminase RidA [Hyphomicrobium sp.]|nr:enamine deaminase RidA [Hyphomicrobium sp.]